MDEDDAIIKQGKLEKTDIPIGNGIKLGRVDIDAYQIKSPKMLQFIVNISGNVNGWDIWVYPSDQEILDLKDILITPQLDKEAIAALENGGKVILSLKKGSLKADKGGDIKVGFSSIFWNTAWTRKQAPHTLGILCDPEHPALRGESRLFFEGEY